MSSAALSHLCDYDFMRCEKCGRLCTKLEVEQAIGPGGIGQACPCGGRKYTPSDLPWWGWFLPRVWTFAVQRIREIGVREALRRDAR